MVQSVHKPNVSPVSPSVVQDTKRSFEVVARIQMAQVCRARWMMASELARRIVDAIAGAKLNDPDGVTDELLAPVRKALLEAAHVPDRGTLLNRKEIIAALASLNPNPKQKTVRSGEYYTKHGSTESGDHITYVCKRSSQENADAETS